MGWLCKLYSNNELKRDVYSQILNYAADIMKVARNANELAAFQRDFICKLQKPDNGIQVIKGKDHTEGKDCFDGIIAGLLGVINAQEPNDDDSTQESGDDGQTQGLDAGGQTQGADAGGQTQGTVGDVDPKFSPQIQDFWNRLWENCKAGYFRLIILCCGSPEGADGGRLRNLINLIYMSEKCSTTYDFIIMDFIDGEAAEKLLPLEAVEKSSQDSRLLRVIWRNYTYLPENPDVVTKRANNDKKLENALNDIKSKVNGYFWDEFLKELKQKFKKEIKEEIIDAGISGNNYTPKFRKKNKKTPETMYISIKATPKGNLEILRRQIRSNEKELYPRIKKNMKILRVNMKKRLRSGL